MKRIAVRRVSSRRFGFKSPHSLNRITSYRGGTRL